MRIRTKTTILFTVLTGIIFLVLNVTVYYFIRSYVNNDFNKRLELRAKLYAKITFDAGNEETAAFHALQQEYLEKLPQEEGLLLYADSIKSETVLPAKLPYSFIEKIKKNNGGTEWYENRFRHYAGILYNNKGTNYIVIKSATNEYGSNVMRQLRIIKLIVFLGSIILIVVVGSYFSEKTFSPITNIITRVKQITEANLHLRLKEMNGTDELTELTETFNRMLTRLETAFETQNNFISNASHELRTPLTAIAGEADYALSKERSTQEYRLSLEKIIQHTEKLKELTKGLLALAQTGFDGKKQTWEVLRADELLFEVKANCDAILPGNKIRINIDQMPDDAAELSIRGNDDLLKIAVSNIMINACKYSDNREVAVHLSFERKKVIIEVKDSGIGIPADELKNIYDPFFRASNTDDYDGFGIGMPLARNIIRLHKGTLDVSSVVNTGTTVKITLPAG